VTILVSAPPVGGRGILHLRRARVCARSRTQCRYAAFVYILCLSTVLSLEHCPTFTHARLTRSDAMPYPYIDHSRLDLDLCNKHTLTADIQYHSLR
jgi:hypothetical protein